MYNIIIYNYSIISGCLVHENFLQNLSKLLNSKVFTKIVARILFWNNLNTLCYNILRPVILYIGIEIDLLLIKNCLITILESPRSSHNQIEIYFRIYCIIYTQTSIR